MATNSKGKASRRFSASTGRDADIFMHEPAASDFGVRKCAKLRKELITVPRTQASRH
jgi:hypothetical protein